MGYDDFLKFLISMESSLKEENSMPMVTKIWFNVERYPFIAGTKRSLSQQKWTKKLWKRRKNEKLKNLKRGKSKHRSPSGEQSE